jgi:hypothetical protein
MRRFAQTSTPITSARLVRSTHTLRLRIPDRCLRKDDEELGHVEKNCDALWGLGGDNVHVQLLILVVQISGAQRVTLVSRSRRLQT